MTPHSLECERADFCGLLSAATDGIVAAQMIANTKGKRVDHGHIYRTEHSIGSQAV